MSERGKQRVAVLISGTGSNLKALLDATAAATYPAELVVVVSNVAGAGGLDKANRAGIESLVLDHRAFGSREAYDEALVEQLALRQVQWVCLAGFMRLLGPRFLDAFPGRVLNIHPSLLPAFPGLHAQRQALAAGVKIAGCTVHHVDEGTDTGPIVAQAAVPVLPGDDEATLTRRILEQEHRLYPAALRAAIEGASPLAGSVPGPLLNPPLD